MLRTSFQSTTRLACASRTLGRTPALARFLHEHDAKYAEKLRQAAESRGTTVDDLKARVREAELKRRKEIAATPPPPPPRNPAAPPAPSASGTKAAGQSPQRRDKSPVKPLSAIFNLARILETPHTAAQISTLWTAYHASRSNGTGRGFLCAAVPVAAYEAMLAAGRRYPTFVLPLARDADPAALVDPAAQQAYEFFFLQWATHEAPPVPTLESETAPFVLPPATPPTGQNPPAATVIYTPLGEYKLRQEFAAPQLALTFYTELAHTHGVVLLRGELTATASPGADGSARYWLSQADAQLLTVALQKFYLWQGEGADGREQLLRAFHEHPADFQWEALLAHAKPV